MTSAQLYDWLKADWRQRARCPLEYGFCFSRPLWSRSGEEPEPEAMEFHPGRAFMVWGRQVHALYVGETLDQVRYLSLTAIMPDGWPVKQRPMRTLFHLRDVSRLIDGHRFRPGASVPDGDGTPLSI